MTRREKKFAYVLAPGVLLLAWRVWAIVARLTPAPAQADASAIQPPDAPSSPTELPLKSTSPHRVYADDVRLARQADMVETSWPRDPFFSSMLKRAVVPSRKGAGPPTPAPPFSLTGLSRCGDRRAALFAGRIVTEGTVLDGDYRVVEIATDSVLIRQADREFRYRLGHPPVEVRREGSER